MPADFTAIHNYYEQQVVSLVTDLAPAYPLLTQDHLPDVACVALNRLPPRYIRHQVDLAFHMTEKERQDSEQLIHDAVVYAFEFVQARYAMRARR
ncbi:MAG: late competence development ComFB family protein [Proteobacteria bacterium]|uniref:late competence development ComFB family protein n=1 Tax=Aquabacterium sp. TaxID=1872578 RepID=UPI0035C6A2E3|nr:late competence development ComFB family protein [Pseudomonadota bacterium]